MKTVNGVVQGADADTTEIEQQINELAAQMEGLSGGGHVVNPEALTPWFAAQQGVVTSGGIANINFISDSFDEGGGGSAISTVAQRQNTLVSLLQKLFDAQFGPVGEGFTGAKFPNGGTDARYLFAGTWVDTGPAGLAGWAVISMGRKYSDAADATFTKLFHGTGTVVHFSANTATDPSTITVTVDGVLKETKQLYAASQVLMTSSVLGLDDGDHTLVVAATAGKISFLGGHDVGVNPNGIRVNRFCLGGSKSTDFGGPTATALFAYYAPALTVISLGPNDFGVTSVADYKAAITALVTEGLKTGSVMLQTWGIFYNVSTGADYYTALQEIASETGCCLFDTYGRIGTATGLLYGNHPNELFHRDEAEALFETIGTTLIQPIKTPYTAADLSNVITFDLAKSDTFFARVDDANAKTITWLNWPKGCKTVTAWYRCRAVATLTDGGTYPSTPTFAADYWHKVVYESFDGGTTKYATLAASYALPVIVHMQHSFTAANSTSVVPAADTGETATVVLGTWGINTNRLYCSALDGTASKGLIVWDKSLADGIIKFKLPVWQNSELFVFRYVDPNNYLGIRYFASAYNLFKKVNGTITSLGGFGIAPANNDSDEVALNGSNIKIYVNGTLRKEATETAHLTATKYGMITTNVDIRWDDLDFASLGDD
jgi:hypothetical protein